MAEPKVLNTRIQLRFDTLENWEAAVKAKPKKIILEKGEVAIAQINKVMPPPPNVKEVSTKSTTVEYMMKVGDGTTSFEDLPWFSAKAADVYDWAKAANFPFTEVTLNNEAETDTDINADGKYVRDIWWDTENKKLKYNKQSFITKIPVDIKKEDLPKYEKNSPTAIAVKDFVNSRLTHAVDYLGAVSSAAEITAIMSKNPGVGDFVRVVSGFDVEVTVTDVDGKNATKKIVLNTGDLLIYETTEQTNSYILGHWVQIPGDTNTWVPNTAGQAGYVEAPLDSNSQTLSNHIWMTDSAGEPGWYPLPKSTKDNIGGGKVHAVRDSVATVEDIDETNISETKNYGVEIDSNGKYFVHVPWTDTKTSVHTHTAGTGLGITDPITNNEIQYYLKPSTDDEIGGGKAHLVGEIESVRISPTGKHKYYPVSIDKNNIYYTDLPVPDEILSYITKEITTGAATTTINQLALLEDALGKSTEVMLCGGSATINI